MTAKTLDGYEPRLKKQYDEQIRQELAERFGLNIMASPGLDKISLNMGVGDGVGEPKALEGAVEDLTIIAGQRAVITRSRKAISNFKIRENVGIGARVTLRGNRKWEFFDRLISLAIPRMRDFRGLSPKGFDGRGNFSFGITDQTIFPEIDYDKIFRVRGMDITIVTTATDDEGGRALLDAYGFPFTKS